MISPGSWLKAEKVPTKGFADRPGWHCCEAPSAPHLTMLGREWWKVEINDFYEVVRPKNQGGKWLIANEMKLIEPVH